MRAAASNVKLFAAIVNIPVADSVTCLLHEAFVHPADPYDLNAAEVAYAEMVFPVSPGNVDGIDVKGPVLSKARDALQAQ